MPLTRVEVRNEISVTVSSKPKGPTTLDGPPEYSGVGVRAPVDGIGSAHPGDVERAEECRRRSGRNPGGTRLEKRPVPRTPGARFSVSRGAHYNYAGGPERPRQPRRDRFHSLSIIRRRPDPFPPVPPVLQAARDYLDDAAFLARGDGQLEPTDRLGSEMERWRLSGSVRLVARVFGVGSAEFGRIILSIQSGKCGLGKM